MSAQSEQIKPSRAPRVPPDKPFFHCIKTSLKRVARKPLVISRLQDAVLMSNKIVIHALQFIKLYLIDCYDRKIPFPLIDKPFVVAVMKILCQEPSSGRPPSSKTQDLKEELRCFYYAYYEPFKTDNLHYTQMNTVLDYLAIDVITMYENNIKLHFFEYVERYVNVEWEKKSQIEIFKTANQSSKIKISHLCQELRRVKNDLLQKNQVKTSDTKYHDWIDREIQVLFPQRPYREDSIYYDIQCHPQDYLPFMFYMMRKIEEKGETINNVCPLRSEIIPKHIRIDTTSLVHLCFSEEHGPKDEYLTKGNLVKYQDEIWGFFFKTSRKSFHLKEDRNSFTFHHMIETDGVACSIVLIRKDLQGKSKMKLKTPKTPSQEKYIDELGEEEYETLQEKKIVGIDPGLNDLLYCVDSDQKDEIHKFRYSQDQRRKETKQKKYRNLLLQWKEEVIDEKSVIEWETELSHYNRKTLDFGRFQDYIQKKNEINLRLSDFYQRYIHRKLKLGSFIRRQITESRMLRRFQKIFGSGKETIIAIGDFEQKQHRRFKEPIKGKGFRALFRRAGYKVYMVDEFRTSCRCNQCEGECETFRWCKNPKFWREGIIKRHGLLRCKNGCGLWNRDTNGAINIWKIAVRAIGGKERPEYLKRTKRSNSGVSSTPTNQDLHEDRQCLQGSGRFKCPTV